MRALLDKAIPVNCESYITRSGSVPYISFVDYSSAIKNAEQLMLSKRRFDIRIGYSNYMKAATDLYDVFKYRDSQSEITHAIYLLKDELNDGNYLKSYFVSKNPFEGWDSLTTRLEEDPDLLKEFGKNLHVKLNQYSSIPILEEWMDVLTMRLASDGHLVALRPMRHYSTSDFKMSVVEFTMHMDSLTLTIQSLLKEKSISINGLHTASDVAITTKSLDDYLDKYSDLLAMRIKDNFVPKFDPKKDKYNYNLYYFDNYCKRLGFSMYNAQKDIAQSMSNHLEKEDVGFIIGEMGVGKTVIGMATVFANLDKSYSTNVILCPPHLVEKWSNEITGKFPNGESIIIDNFDHFMEVKNRIGQTEKHLFLIMSNSKVRTDYQIRPSVLYSKSQKHFKCPECGGKLYGYERCRATKQEIIVNLKDEDFTKPLKKNENCINCNAKLWSPVIRDDDLDWIKMGQNGWVMKDRIDDLIEDYTNRDTLMVKESKFLVALSKAKKDIENDTITITAPQKYQISKYLREFHKKDIDFLIADEIQDYKGSTSRQGEAFGDLIRAAKKTIGLTGTLLNGYASSLFYLLFRAFPRQLLAKGYDYQSSGEFVEKYGVTKTTEKISTISNSYGQRIGSPSKKEMPGVSPLVFADFLLENAVFIGLEDIAEGLPPYEEIPIGVDMDVEMKEQYGKIERDARRLIGFNTASGFKTMGSMLQLLSVYPDTPYNQPPISHPDTGEVLMTVPSMQKINRVKEAKLLELVEKKIANGENVLVYYQWANRSDVGGRLTEYLNSNNIKTAHLTSSVKAQNRESWIKKKVDKEGVRVVVCTSALVETGLDLLDFTTIVFYQVGYNLFTLRQASRRSWRLSQPNPVEVYFLYYKDTIQEKALSLMANKLKAAMVIEGKFNEEGLHALSNEEDLLVQIASSVAEGVKHTVGNDTFEKVNFETDKTNNKNTKIDTRLDYANFSYFTPNPSYGNKKHDTVKYLNRLLKNKDSIYNLVSSKRKRL